MELKILGPVSAELDGRAVALDGGKQRTALAALLLARGKVVSDERLTLLLWGWDPPATSRNQLYTYMSRLRTRLGTGLGLERHGPGYRMDIRDARFDWDDFRELADSGRDALHAGRHAEAERLLHDALALWRGPALTDVTAHLAEAEVPRMEEARLSALENHAEAALALGRHTDMVPALTRQVTLHPVRERLRGQLMTALFRCGRQADALTVYEKGRRALAEDLGIDPGPELRALHQEILTGRQPPTRAPERDRATPTRTPGQHPEPRHTAPVPAPPGAEVPGGGWQGLVPAMLPAAPGDFTGRAAEARDVLAALRGHQDVVVTGAPGTGKSALALWAAERCRADFPGGQLYADLRTAEGGARAPGEVLGWFLRALGTAPDRLPATQEERVQLYRTLLARSRPVLIVLDNATDDAQVRPLLPGSGGSRTLVSGVRSPLASLEGTRLVGLGPMEPAEAGALLAAVAGPERFAGAPGAAARIAELCDRLPLALRIAAARLAAHPHWPAARLAERLAPEDRRLGELRIGSLDVRAGLRTALSQLDRATRTAFAVLARAGLSALTAGDAAALLGTGPEEAEELLERLADARLLEAWSVDGDARLSYRFMPLVGLFAREQCADPVLAPAPA